MKEKMLTHRGQHYCMSQAYYAFIKQYNLIILLILVKLVNYACIHCNFLYQLSKAKQALLYKHLLRKLVSSSPQLSKFFIAWKKSVAAIIICTAHNSQPFLVVAMRPRFGKADVLCVKKLHKQKPSATISFDILVMLPTLMSPL